MIGGTGGQASAPPRTAEGRSPDAPIDAEYVEGVLAALDHVQGEVVRRLVATGKLTATDRADLRAVFADPEYAIQVEGFAQLLADVDRAKRPPGDNVSSVVSVVSASRRCIYAETLVDVSATVVDPPPPYRLFVALRPKARGADPEARNPTGWAIAAEHPDRRDACR